MSHASGIKDVDQESPASASKEKLYRLLEARINNSEGTWVQCCKPKCNKWRCLQNVADPNEVPDEWYCFMNKDTQYNSCAAAEQDMSQEEFVDVKFFVGSIVWAKLGSCPWWPAMIDDDPDSCLYFCNEDPYDEDRVNMEKDIDSDFNDLATVDCSQFFSKEE
ncbi:hypothetical protein HPB47_001069 [Ixodes persulcatus]|uniref:Uncharacterized protein n=1 Tax=Ixodes persulcatus TaxID=34615 RepID=A0AC60PQQ8_IXOPE|nr:hypothetical protein HPB47_001069 [Ixodes persulcatus]